TGAGAKEIRLKPGQYKVEASKDGKVVRQELVTIAQNGRQVVRISKEAAPLTDPGRWEREVAELTAEQQVKAGERQLKERNPAFDNPVGHQIEDGVVRRLSFYTDGVTDISPVRVNKGLVSLMCRGSNTGKGTLADLTPLRGLPLLTNLDANCNQV